MNCEYRAACFGFQQKQRWSAEFRPSQTDSGWFKGPCQGLVYKRDLLHCLLILPWKDLVMLWEGACAGRKAFHTTLCYHGAPVLRPFVCGLWSQSVKSKYSPLIWYHVQHKPVGLLVPTRTSFFSFYSIFFPPEKQTSKPDIWDLIISSDGESVASLDKLFQWLIMLMKSMELL